VYKCRLDGLAKDVLCEKRKATKSCLKGSITGGECPYLTVSYARVPKMRAVRTRLGRTPFVRTPLGGGRIQIPTDIAPPLTQREKERVIRDVGTRCCYPRCREAIALDVHHITPRSEGGSNRESNLIVLCPNHHRLARDGTVPRQRLRLYSVKTVKKIR
jgi:hypothetical protein